MTWKEFKEAVEVQGVKDDDKLWYVKVGFSTTHDYPLAARKGTKAAQGWAITS